METSIPDFETCARIARLLDERKDELAREEVIRLLGKFPEGGVYGQLINTLIRYTGLFPYVQIQSASWQDRYACEAFRVDNGTETPITLHREQSLVLKKLLNGDNLAVSAPTSFGKSFIIDAFIAIRRPAIVVILVPTIALADETRRRLQRKFGSQYCIITTTGVEIEPRSIFIFPAERAISYVTELTEIDLLIVDEFYKADSHFDRDRSPALLRAITRLTPLAKQRYFLAPNIKHVEPNDFTDGMDFLPLDFRTVLLDIDRAYLSIGSSALKKEEYLLQILEKSIDKTLIYAGSHSSVDAVANCILAGHDGNSSPLLNAFASWLERHYGSEWNLPDLIRIGTGIHSGRLHRFLAQIQVHLFDLDNGLQNIISTSSIIEGVNTQAKNVIIWKSKNGSTNLKDFAYKNIIGRGGRAFKHFIGNVYLLDKPPPPEDSTLTLDVSDDILNSEPALVARSKTVTKEQIARIAAHKEEMRSLVGATSYDEAIMRGQFVTTDKDLLRAIAISVRNNEWNGIGFLNSGHPDKWDRLLFNAIDLDRSGWNTKFTNVVNFVKALSHNWTRTIPEIVQMLGWLNVNTFFSLERDVSFRLSSILQDVNTINKIVKPDAVDISPFIIKIGSAFLPQVVFELEEYGLPRMVARKLQESRVIDFDNPELSLHGAIGMLNRTGLNEIRQKTENLTQFDVFLLKYFFQGIQTRFPPSPN